jgi:SAM-dependent methyltransferase
MPPRQQAAKRVEFRHGLGDGVQLTIVLRHLAFYHPEWEIDLAALKGKETVGRGLTRRQLILGEASGVTYEKVWSLDWDECREAYSQWPSTKPTRCLREVFGLEPRLELFGYQIERSPAADARAQAYLAEVCARSASPAQIASPRVTHVSTPTSRAAGAAVLIHYQGNTSGERKDLTHEVARRVCDTVRELGYVPVILDWDRRSPLVDQKTVFNPGADHPLWGGAGTGDAEILAALIEASALMIGIDSGPLHVAGATSTPTIGVWTKHHPVHYFDLCPNVRHLVPTNHRSLANGPAAVEFFEGHYEHRVYRDLAASLVAEVRHVLTGEPLAEEPEEKPTGSPVKILKSTQYDQQYYEEHCRTGLDYLNFGDWQRQYGKWFVESLGFHKRRVVDVGCACGAILRGLGDAGAIVAGFDLSEHMIGLGREKWPDMKSLLHVANAKSLPFYGSSSWDGIHCGQVAEHWPPEDVPQILKELNRVTAPGGLFFCTLDTQELFDRQRRSVETDDPTHLCIRPRAWWTEQLAATGWTDCTAEYEPQLRNHPNSFLKKYDWDFFVARKEPRSLPAAPYDLGRYPEIWRWSGASVDRRHLFWMYDILQGCRFEHALEIGCLNGASSTAFVEAINRGYLGRATLCDIELRPSLQQVVSQCTEPERVRTYQGRSVDLLRSQAGFDVIWVDGDHRLENVRAEVDLLLAQRPVCVMAHDTNAQAVTYPDCDGPPYLKWAFQTAAGYQCLEDNTVRPGEDTGRGMFLATTSSTVFDVAREALRKWGAPMPDIE